MTDQTRITRGTEWWDSWFIGLAKYISTASKDPSTQMGCVVVGPDREVRSTGFNGFPRGVVDAPERLADREFKYAFICHAEENAIMHAARIGVSLKGCVAYTSSWPPCTRCARSLVQAGVIEVIHPWCEIPERWREDFDRSALLLSEAGVNLRTLRECG